MAEIEEAKEEVVVVKKKKKFGKIRLSGRQVKTARRPNFQCGRRLPTPVAAA